jgi:hypothetical protein
VRSHAVGAFLDEGYSVRGTVRSQDKGEYLAKLFAGKKAKFEYAIVKDIAEVSRAVRWFLSPEIVDDEA